MNLLKLNSHPRSYQNHRHRHRHRQINPRSQSIFLFRTPHQQNFELSLSIATPLYSFTKYAKTTEVKAAIPFSIEKNEEEESEDFGEYLAEDGEVYQKTLRLVECAMFAAVSGLAFILSNSLAIEVFIFFFFQIDASGLSISDFSMCNFGYRY